MYMSTRFLCSEIHLSHGNEPNNFCGSCFYILRISFNLHKRSQIFKFIFPLNRGVEVVLEKEN